MKILPIVLGLAVGLSACTENIGTPPLVPGSKVAVVAEEFAGPVFPRAITGLVARGERIWVATDRGLYLTDLTQWLPGFGGLIRAGGEPVVVRVENSRVDLSGQLSIHLARLGPEFVLSASRDGGRAFERLELPNILAGEVTAIDAITPWSGQPEGAYFAVQGLLAAALAPGSSDWVSASLPESPVALGTVGAGGGGRVAMAAEIESGWTVWRSVDGGASFESTGVTTTTEPIAVSVTSSGTVAWATESSVHHGGETFTAPANATIRDVSFLPIGATMRVLLLTQASAGWSLWRGTVGSLVERSAPNDPIVGTLSATTDGGWVADLNGNLHQLAGETGLLQAFPFEGAELDWSALAVDPRTTGQIYLGERRGQTHVYVGPPDDMRSLGSPFFQSQMRSLLPDLTTATGVFAGSFGFHARATDADMQPWETRNNGQFNYLQENFSQPINVQTLAVRPGQNQELWMGGINNNGPYRSLNSGQLWSRVHGGLGEPYSLPDEDGLPSISQVRAYAFPEDEVWMAGFRGGMWKWDEALDVWSQANRGLPDLTGAAVDTCCFAPLEVEVDVRDVVVLDNGSLLAATSWGIYLDRNRGGAWELSSQGLTNGDVYTLATHPDRPGWVAAGSRGTTTNRDWLFLSVDGAATWRAIDTQLEARFCEDLVWSDPDAAELVARLDRSGAWRLEVDP